MSEFSEKQSKIQALLNSHDLDALLLQRVSSFAWATGGAASYVNTAVSSGEASLLVAPTGLHLFTNNIEATRLEQEEGLKAQGWQFHAAPWFEAQSELQEMARGLKLGADLPYPGAVDLSAEISGMRIALTPEEGERFRQLGRLCAEAMDAAIKQVKPGQSEYELAALVGGELQSRGVQPIVNLVATDERISRFRHPLPTAKKLERYAMLVLCGRWRGLVASMTRLLHFGPLPEKLRRKAEATALIDAAFIAATRPGRRVADVFQAGVDMYRQTGFPDEWRLHHQGGPAAYEPRELVATPDSTAVVGAGEAYAWNPSITGMKSEDTILVGEGDNEILTAMPGWPEQIFEIEGQPVARPAIWEVL